MIYSVMSSSFIFAEWDDFNPQYEEIKLSSSASLMVEDYDKNSIKIVRLISSNPVDYLNSDYLPGTIYKK